LLAQPALTRLAVFGAQQFKDLAGVVFDDHVAERARVAQLFLPRLPATSAAEVKKGAEVVRVAQLAKASGH
jgi:hypothetical protein